MIHSKIKKGKTSELLVEFYRNQELWPSVISRFYQTCKQQNVRITKTLNIKPEMLRLYTIEESSMNTTEEDIDPSTMDLNKILNSRMNSIDLKFTVIYINEDQYSIPKFQSFVNAQNSLPRVLLLRQTLESFFDLDFQIQNTLSQQQSVIYLCDLAAMIITCKNQSEVQLYDQKKDKMIRKGNQGQMTQMEVIWRNILFQTPGVGKDKCKLIAQKFQTYQHIIKDCDKGKQLKNLQVQKGTKSMKIGSAIAERIYKVFGSINGKQPLY